METREVKQWILTTGQVVNGIEVGLADSKLVGGTRDSMIAHETIEVISIELRADDEGNIKAHRIPQPPVHVVLKYVVLFVNHGTFEYIDEYESTAVDDDDVIPIGESPTLEGFHA